MTSSPGSVTASRAPSRPSPSLAVITTSVPESYSVPDRRCTRSATARHNSGLPVNGRYEFDDSAPMASRVASTASAGGARSVSRFSSRNTSGSAPAAAATRSMLNPATSASRAGRAVMAASTRPARRVPGALARILLRSPLYARTYSCGNGGQPRAAPRRGSLQAQAHRSAERDAAQPAHHLLQRPAYGWPPASSHSWYRVGAIVASGPGSSSRSSRSVPKYRASGSTLTSRRSLRARS